MEQISKRLLGQEDVNWDSSGAGGRADFPGGDGQMKPLHKINASHIPLTSETRASVDGATNVDYAIAVVAQKISEISSSAAMTEDTVIDFLSSDSPTIMQNKINAQKKNLGGHTLTFRFPYGVDHHLLFSLVFDGFSLGKLVVTGNDDDDRSNIFDDADIGSLFRFEDCLCDIQVHHFSFHANSSACSIYALRDTSLLVSDCVFIGTKFGVKAEMSFVNFSGCTFDDENKRINVVNSQFLPLTGGTIRGNIFFSDSLHIGVTTDRDSASLSGGPDLTHGGSVRTYGDEYVYGGSSANAGGVNLCVTDGNGSVVHRLSALRGGFFWDGKEILPTNKTQGRPNYAAAEDITNAYLGAVDAAGKTYTITANGWIVGIHQGNHSRALHIHGQNIIAGLRLEDEYRYQNICPVKSGDKIFVSAYDTDTESVLYNASTIFMKIIFIPEA